jgi:Bacteriophage HK97-gp10, putative tail-component
MNLANIRGAASLNIRVEGLNELDAQFARIGKMPKKHLSRAARLGMADPLRQAKANAPIGKNTTTRGTLKKSITKKMETPNKRNKSVYRLIFSPKYTDDFLKKGGKGKYGGKDPAYYPHSVEYGFKRKNGRTPGKYFMAKAISQHQQASLQKIVDSLKKSIDELL